MLKLILILLLSCTTQTPSNVSSEKAYARNLSFNVDSVPYSGVANVGRKNEFQITAKFPKKFVKGFFQTCNREVIFYDSDKIDYKWLLSPKEREGQCPGRLEFFNEKGQFYWGLIYPKTEDKVSGIVDCNGAAIPAQSYLCMMREGLNTAVHFLKKPDNFVYGSDCAYDPRITTRDGLNYSFSVTPSFCTVTFKFGADFFNLLIFGYNDIYSE